MRLRFLGAVVAVVLLALLIHDIPLFLYLHEVEEDRIVTTLERDAFVLAGRSEASLHSPNPDPEGAISETARRYRESGGARVVIVDRAGRAIVTSDDDASAVGTSYLSRPEIAAALQGEVVTGTRFSETLGEELLYVAVPVLSGSRVFGAVRLTYPAAVVAQVANQKIAMVGVVGLTTVVLAGLIALLFSTSVTRRLRLLRDMTERFAGGERTARADETSGAPELRSLARSFNSMADRLHVLIDQQRAFAADASHQLRTPLTALRLRLERARELVVQDPEGALRRLEAAEQEVDRLSGLVEGLLLLSKAEGGALAIAPVDLAEKLAQRAEQWDALAAESGRSVRLEPPRTHLRVLAAETAVEQIIDNLLDNALAVTPAAGVVTLRIAEEDGRVALHVLDQGPGLAEDERRRAFERFWRGRSEHPGSGLGLAIVEQLAAASGASVDLAPRDGGGLDAAVRFVPASPRIEAAIAAVPTPR